MADTLKIAIRTEADNGMIVGYASTMDDRRRICLSTLALSLARKHPAVFEAWKAMLQQALAEMLAAHGVEVSGWNDIRPQEKN